MNFKEIKIGESYLLPVTVSTIKDTKYIDVKTIEPFEYRLAPSEVEHLLPNKVENGTKNTETAPKYDPNRKFREGDKVRIIAHRGRLAYDEGLQYPPDDTVFIVEHNELQNGIVSIFEQPECEFDAFDIHFSFLELVTPVEELDPYTVDEDNLGWNVIGKDGFLVAHFCKDGHPHAKEAAEAECARLNAEYRKEMEL